jgi:hypothetical protein
MVNYLLKVQQVRYEYNVFAPPDTTSITLPSQWSRLALSLPLFSHGLLQNDDERRQFLLEESGVQMGGSIRQVFADIFK